MLQRTIMVQCVLAAMWMLNGWIAPASATTVTSLDFVSGSVDFDGRFHRVLDQLLDQQGTLIIGAYQPAPNIVPPITKGHTTYSLFTSGVNGAAAPSLTISGSSITLDLSSLYLGVNRGDHLQAWNIGGIATGTFNPATSDFSLSWDHILNRGSGQGHGGGLHERTATFFLQGTVVSTPAAIALPGSLFLYVTGLFGLGSWGWWRRRQTLASA